MHNSQIRHRVHACVVLKLCVIDILYIMNMLYMICIILYTLYKGCSFFSFQQRYALTLPKQTYFEHIYRQQYCFEMYSLLDICGSVPTNDKQTPPLSFDPTFMKEAQCGETNKKTIFRFLFFELL